MKLAKIINGLVLAGMLMPVGGLAMEDFQGAPFERELEAIETNLKVCESEILSLEQKIDAHNKIEQLLKEVMNERFFAVSFTDTKMKAQRIEKKIADIKQELQQEQREKKRSAEQQALHIEQDQLHQLDDLQPVFYIPVLHQRVDQSELSEHDQIDIATSISREEAERKEKEQIESARKEREHKRRAELQQVPVPASVPRQQPAAQPRVSQFQGNAAARLDVNPPAQQPQDAIQFVGLRDLRYVGQIVDFPAPVQSDVRPAQNHSLIHVFKRNWKNISIALSAAVLTALGAWWWFKKQ